MSIKSLVLIASRYPCNLHRTWHVFVREIAHSFARQGVQVTVISPLSVHRAWLGHDLFRTVEDAGEGAIVTVFRPRFLSMSSKRIGRLNSSDFTISGIQRTSRSVILQQMSRKPDAIYGHFLYPAGFIAVNLAKEMGIPAFPAAGEHSLYTVDFVGRERACRELAQATAFIANSNHLAQLISRNLGIDADRIGVFPNGINRSIFFPRKQSSMRQKYGLPLNQFIVAFVGYFQYGKGARRVSEAIQSINGVAGVFIGSGEEPPKGEKVIFCRQVSHEQVPELLSACDIFVLPTTNEGCCNAIIEAMACGLPIVSSTGSFNDDILNDNVSIRVDPLVVPAIRSAIVRLKDDSDLRVEMGRAALTWSQNFDIDLRARRILEFMAQRMNQTESLEDLYHVIDARGTKRQS